ncbi:cyclodeaminase/cyclohydrolase family protein [Maribacter arenosus]|uniref:Cyclodeaminase/cyclohydrolase family protein n=1 Tax=Maribacter arenosus TaxID=1854708 RepID=A0ABR7VG77_9FLAO|nr:cyclodeaminase/cyclohydrolase family protein [Maribacter arenosus]MBD0851865.1 cyclodeaminase/cyclohydrolase family protein [Maribacter arenosus]
MSKQGKLELIEKEEAGDKDYLSVPALELIEAFGEGNHIPGSGSASALSGLIGVELMKTVLKLSIGREGYEDKKKEFEFILKTIEEQFIDTYKNLFNSDIKIFHDVSYYRRLRDKAAEGSTEKEKYGQTAVDKLKEATDIPIEICETSLQLMKNAFFIFDNGYKATRGDSGVAISNLLSSAQGALFIVFLNLKTLKKSQWKEDKMKKAVSLALRFTQIQKEAYRRVISLYNESSDDNQLTLDFYKED